MSKGAYVLFLNLPETRTIHIGRFGTFNFSKGCYLYVGSAMNNLEKRIARHMADKKRLHWHIDYVLPFAEVQDVLTIEAENRIECTMNQALSKNQSLEVAVKGFGSSDCRCASHLWRAAPAHFSRNMRTWTKRDLSHIAQMFSSDFTVKWMEKEECIR